MKYKSYLDFSIHSLGFWIGVFIFVSLLFLFTCFFSPRNSIREEHILQYMNESEEIQVIMPLYESDLYTETFGNKTIIRFLSRRGRGKSDVYYITFYSQEYKKYFILWFFDSSGFFFVRDKLWDGNKVNLTINRYEMNSPDYGTKEKPIPVLKVVGVEKPLRYKALDHDANYMKENYHTNIEMYLSYEMPKEEFRQRFIKE